MSAGLDFREPLTTAEQQPQSCNAKRSRRGRDEDAARGNRRPGRDDDDNAPAAFPGEEEEASDAEQAKKDRMKELKKKKKLKDMLRQFQSFWGGGVVSLISFW